MIHAFEPDRGQAAIRADPCLIIDSNFFGLYPADKNEDPPPIPYRPANNENPPLPLFNKGGLGGFERYLVPNLSFLRPASKKKTKTSFQRAAFNNLPKNV